MTKLTKLSDQFAPIRKAAREANDQAKTAVGKAIYCGQLLNELKDRVEHGDFLAAVEANVPEIGRATAWRWMTAARNVLAATSGDLKQLGFGGGETTPLSALLDPDSPVAASADTHLARQLLFDFTAGKTMRECLAAVVVDGEDAHRITRAHNGRTAGGTKGEDRRAWPEFIRRKLSDISTHLKSWRTMTGAQTEAIEAAYKIEISKWPAPLLETLKKTINDELKSR